MFYFKKNFFRFCFLNLIFFLIFCLFSQVSAEERLDPYIQANTITIIANAAKLVLGLIGVIALIFMIYGGVIWMTASGNVEKVKKGKHSFIWAAMGLIFCFLAYSIITFIIKKITTFTTQAPNQHHVVEFMLKGVSANYYIKGWL